ncbi:flavoprotein [Phytoactinopolyspora mesophila]|uniref:Flavoprotein n=1 Tax=Phytoactinopolyspora mesophila TaxID=2650750 RepID=A0A7K3MB44_9ACTN|nr:flavoprotein [Phytoactinopolyspora mesophila]
MTGPVLGLVACAAGGIEHIRSKLIAPMQADGWTVAVTLTPTAATWLRASGEYSKIEALTGLPVRAEPRLPSETSPHPPVDCYAVVPATANTVAKLSLGIADNQALTTVCEAIGNRRPPVVIFPRINAAHAAQPAWSGHLEALRQCDVRLVYGEDVWPLHPPRTSPGRKLPWQALRAVIAEVGGRLAERRASSGGSGMGHG